MNLVINFIFLLQFFTLCWVDAGKVVLMDSNTSLSFHGKEAFFSPPLKGQVMFGVLFMAKPLDACQKLSNKPENNVNDTSSFVLIIRGNCSFEHKIRNAQRSGFKAAIVYDVTNSNILKPSKPHLLPSISTPITVDSNVEFTSFAVKGDYTNDLKIPAVFVTKTSGETLKRYIGSPDYEVMLITTDSDMTLWSVVAMIFISLSVMLCIVAIFVFNCWHRNRVNDVTSQTSPVHEFGGMSPRLVKAMKSLLFSSAKEDDKSTDHSCCICFEDYNVGDKIRVLPCEHKFHASCVDFWLTTKKTFCPMCKRDVRMSTFEPPASENTPLQSPTSSYEELEGSSMEIMSSFVYFSPLQESSSSNVRRSFRSASTYRSSNLRVSRSFEDIRHQTSPLQLVSQRSYSSWTTSSSWSPVILSLSRNESAETFFSPFASSQSLPEFITEPSSL